MRALLAALLLWTATAQADREPRELKKLLAVGDDAYEHGFYGDALGVYLDAYQLSQSAPLLLKIGSCYEHLKNWADAADAYRRYVSSEPMLSAGGKSELAAKAAALEARAKVKVAAPPEPPAVVAAPVAPPPPPPTRVVGFRRAVLVSAIATGVVTLIAGGVTIGAASAYGRLNSDCRAQSSGCSVGARDRVAALDHAADSMWALAAAGAITSVVLHVVLRHERRLHAAIAPGVGGARAMIGVEF